MTEEHRERVTAFQIGVEPVGNMLGAYLLPPDGHEIAGQEKILLASVRRMIHSEPGIEAAFKEFLKAIAMAMVRRHTDAQTAATVETDIQAHPKDNPDGER